MTNALRPVFSRRLLLLAALPCLLSAQPTVNLTSSPNPSMFGTAVTLTASLTPNTSTGRVTFYDGVTVLGSKALASGSASISTIALPAGRRKLRALYVAATGNTTATSNVVTQVVNAQISAGFAAKNLLQTPIATVFAAGDLNGDGLPDLVINDGTSFTLGTITSSGPGTFNLPVDVNMGANFAVNSVAFGDFNGDGKADVVATTNLGNSLAILFGNGDGTLQNPVKTNFTSPVSVAVGDFNGDGKADLLVLGAGTAGISILLGNGDGSFQTATNPVTGSIVSYAIADFNGDNKPDLAVYDGTNFRILLGQGDGTFQQASSISIQNLPSNTVTLAAADFNADGKTDLAVAAFSSQGSQVFILLGNGDGTLRPAVSYAAAQGRTPLVADMNGDGNLDLILSGTGGVTVLLGKGDGTFQAPLIFPSLFNTFTLIAGDFNGDNRTDLVLADGNFLLGTTVSVTPTGGNPQSTVNGTAFPTQLQVTVRDVSGPISGVTVTFTPPSSGASAVLSSSTAMTNASGVASVSATANGQTGNYNVVATALGVSTAFTLTNLTAAASQISISPTSESTGVGTAFPLPLQVTLTDSTGLPASGVTVTFTPPATGASATLSSTTAVTNANGTASVTATANNTAGGYQVKATAGTLTANFSLVNLQSITVTLVSSSTTANLGSPITLTAVISNSTAAGQVTFFDGVSIIGTKQANTGVAAINGVLLSAGVHKLTAYYRDNTNGVVGTSAPVSETIRAAAGGAFIAQAPITQRPAIPAAVAADLNGDGNEDFAIPQFVTGIPAVTVLLGKGDGTFQSAANYTVGSATATPGPLVAGDFNNDGKLDLAVTVFTVTGGSSGTASVVVLLGNGDGTFNAGVVYPAGTTTLSGIAVADFNNDGKPDFVLTSSAGTSLLLGNGNGTFGAPVAYSAIGGVMTVADFNGDGKPDVAVGTAILLGNGDGTAQTPILFNFGAAGAIITSLIAGDFNNDGKVDLAVGATIPGNAAATYILLGNGDGTFQAAVSYSLGSAVAIGDFNGDGILDLVVGNTAGSSVGILQGKADGTFQTGPTLAASTTVAVTDFNNDGREDLLTSNAANGTMIVLLGATNVSLTVTATGGATQTASLGTAFAAPLQVTVVNNGIPVSGATVTYTAPTSGASAVLSSSTATTNASGVASITATANSTAGSYSVTATYQGVSATFNLTNTAFAFITASGGTPQSTPIGQAFANPLQVTVKDGVGNPVNNVTVTFAAPTTGASAALSSTSATTNASGVASITATANTIAGSYNVTATVGNLSATFALTNLSGAAASVAATGGTPQTALTGTAFANPLQATVKDSNGNPVSGVTVTFAAPASGATATLSGTTALTNASGVASVTATANPTPGTYNVTATVGSFSASFTLTNTGIGSVTATGGTPQSAGLGAAFAAPLQATVKDTAGNPVSGVTVTFAAPPTGASATLSGGTAVTNASGVASVTATANSILGSYTVTATVATFTASFSLTNTAGAAATLTATGGTLQTTGLGTAFGNPLQATAKDGNGNPVQGVTVTFSVPTVGASAVLSSSTAVTNASGVASVTATANNIAGSYLVTASVGPLSTSFSLTNILINANGDLAQGQPATQSSTLPGSPSASVAVDGITNGNYFSGSVTATNQDTNAWWQVDLGSSASIASIVVWNRTDCCGTRLSDFWVFASNTPFQNSDTPATLQGRAGTFASHQTSAPSPSVTINLNGFQGRYVRVQLSGTDYLSLAEVQVFGTGGTQQTNLAVGRPATQSSTIAGVSSAAASSAVDGNTDGQFFDGSVTATNADSNAWWQVDLGVASTINSVVVYNRTDCCSDRLSDFWVFVSNTPFLPTDTPSTLQNRPGTFASHQTSAPNPSTSIPVGAQGRYVRVQLSGTNNLSLAEVQVLGIGQALTNLSQGRPAIQSSTLAGTPPASVAVDGNTDGNFNDGSVTATNADPNAWWQVDLGASAAVSSVVIWNRTDCCSSRLTDYWVFVSDTPFLATDTPATLQNRPNTFSSHLLGVPNPSTTVPLSAQGRYVRVQLNDTDYLSLAEVQVFGTGGAPAPTNLAQGKTATQSSTLLTNGGGASVAVDGNTDGNFFDGSVTATNQDPNSWWQVDLGASKSVNSVVVWNRTDCCGTRLGDFWVFVSNTPFLATDTPATLMNRAERLPAIRPRRRARRSTSR